MKNAGDFGYKGGVLVFSAPRDPGFIDHTARKIPTIRDLRREYAKKDRQQWWKRRRQWR